MTTNRRDHKSAGLVHIVDDDPGFRKALSWMLSLSSIDVCSHASGEDFLQAWQPEHPGCIILDLRMSGLSGLEVQQRLRNGDRYVPPVLFLTARAEVPDVILGMERGAYAFLTKPCPENVMMEKVRGALDHDHKARQLHRHRETIAARLALLSARERQVLDGVLSGSSNKVIARELALSPKTVELHRAKLMKKMHADNVVELVRTYLLLNPPNADDLVKMG